MHHPQKNNPNDPEHCSQCRILNDFIHFILELDINLSKSKSNFKQNAIKVVECLKFIKLNPVFIAYAVEHRADPKIYRYKRDQRKGVIRDFNDTALHFNSYSSKERVKTGLENLVQQFEQAILAMSDLGKLDTFAYQLEYDEEIGCIERRTAKALAYAAEYLSSHLNNLDDLMGQCEFLENSSESAFVTAHDFLKPYLGGKCIWQDKEYVLDEALIKQYLTEIFYFDYETSVGESIQEEPLSWNGLLNVFKNGLVKDCLDLIGKISSSQWDDILLKYTQGHLFLYSVIKYQPTQVSLALINRVGSSVLEQVLAKLSADQFSAVLKTKSSVICKALLKQLDHIPHVPLRAKAKLAIYAKEFGFRPFNLTKFMATVLNPLEVIKKGINNSTLEIKECSLTGVLKKICLYQSPEVFIEFIIKLSKKQLKEIVLPLDLPELEKSLPYFFLSKNLHVPPRSNTFFNYLKGYQPLKDKLMSHDDPLLANCIDFYFEGKGDIPPELRGVFIAGLQAKVSLSKKGMAFLEVLHDDIPTTSMYAVSDNETPSTSKSVDLNPDPQHIGRYGVLSWHHYRQLRMQFKHRRLQSVLDQLFRADLLFNGSDAVFTGFLSNNLESATRNDFDAVQRASVCIQEFKGLLKIIKPEAWPFFVDQLENLNERPKLRREVDSPTHKLVHLTGNIVPYQKKRRQKTNYTHTKKTSTTLLSPQMATGVFGENLSKTCVLVGLLFDLDQCHIKAMLLTDASTLNHDWLGNKRNVNNFKLQMANINQTDWGLFLEELRERAHHNEVLAKVSKEAMRAIVIARDTPKARRIAIERHAEVVEKFAIDLPIIFYTSSLQSLRHYSLSEQQDDRRAWAENLKVCSLREQVSKSNVLTILNKSLNKNDWQLGPLGSGTRIKNKPVPRTVVFFAAEVAKAYKSEQSENSSYTWVEAEQKISNLLIEKTTQSRFFQAVNGRSNDTVNFFKDLLKVISRNR